jgi:hypothetical protein
MGMIYACITVGIIAAYSIVCKLIREKNEEERKIK